jgi:hypothetical protein
MVEGGELRLVPSLDDRENRRVNEADVRVGVPFAYLAHPRIILHTQILNYICPVHDVVQERSENARMQSNVYPIIYFHENGGRNHERLV